MSINEVLGVLVFRLPSIVFGIIAGLMVLYGVDGWGWFLFAAIIALFGSFRSGDAATESAKRKRDG